MDSSTEKSVYVVVGVIVNGTFDWYVSRKGEWFLNRVEFARIFGEKPFDEDVKLLSQLESDRPEYFLKKIRDFRVTKKELTELFNLYSEKERQNILDILPTAVFDFDNKCLLNRYPEPGGSFEDFLPKDWEGKYCVNYRDVLNAIPPEMVYWNEETLDSTDWVKEILQP